MRFEVDTNGRLRSLTVEQTGTPGRLRFTVDGSATLVDAARVDERTWSIVLPDRRNASWQVAVTDSARPGPLTVQVNGVPVRVEVNGRRVAAEAVGEGVHQGGVQRIVAMMPGRIVRVLVAPGDQVAEGQSVVVVEAMKMENEFRARKDGTVKEVAATVGASVEAGKILVVIE